MGQPSAAVGIAVGECAGVDLGEVEAEDAAEGALELEGHHLQHRSAGGAEAVEKDGAVGEGGVGIEVVEPDIDCVVLAGVGLAGGGTVDRIDHGAVGVKDDGDGKAGGGRSGVGGCDDLADGVDLHVCAADIFVELALIGEQDGGSGYGTPKCGGGIDHGDGLLIGDGGREWALVDVVVDLAMGPVERLAESGGIEVGCACDVSGTASEGWRGSENEGASHEG